MYEARWQNGNPQWMAVDLMEAVRLLDRHPRGSSAALDALSEGRLTVATAFVAQHPAETNGLIEVRLREVRPYTRPTPTPDENGEVLWA